MVGKVDQVLEYIEALSPGVRVSVRQLARELSVSEGTAYKAVCQAKERGLVQSKPKSGTVRVLPVAEYHEKQKLSGLVERLNLTVMTGSNKLNQEIGTVVLGDGSRDQLMEQLAAAEGMPLCIVGERPDIIECAVTAGIGVLVTGGTTVNDVLLKQAEESGCILLASEKDSVSLLFQIAGEMERKTDRDDLSDRAGDWMEEPLYLYHNDVAADWHRLYRPVFSAFSKCAVVDDERKICGTVDALQVNSAELTSKIASLYLSDGHCLAEEEDIPVSVLADRMLETKTLIAYLTREGVVSGIITAGDLLRYYRMKIKEALTRTEEITFETLTDYSKDEPREYKVHLPEYDHGREDIWMFILPRAAILYGQELKGCICECETGSYYRLTGDFGRDDLSVICEVVSREEEKCILSAALYNGKKCCARGTFIIR